MKILSIATYVALLFVAPSAVAQQTASIEFSIVTIDAELGTKIVNATIIDLTTNELITTNSGGAATFSQGYLPDIDTTLQISAPGFPETFRLVSLPSIPVGYDCSLSIPYVMTIQLSTEKLYLSPPVGVQGGERVVMHATGQMVYDDDTMTGTPTEYLQRIKITVPAGALTGQFRIGLTPVKTVALNNAYSDTIASGAVTRHLAQFRLGLYDLNGNQVPSPVFASPIRIEISPATFAFWTTMTEAMSVQFRHFDPASYTWDQSGISDSGWDTASKSYYVDVDHFSVYSAVDVEPNSEENCPWNLRVWPHECGFPLGLSVADAFIADGEGPATSAKHNESYTSTDVVTTGDGSEFGATFEAKLAGYGITLGQNAENSTTTTTTKTSSYAGEQIPTGNSPDYQIEVECMDENGVSSTELVPGTGTVYLRQLINHFELQRICVAHGNLHGQKVIAHLASGLCTDRSNLHRVPNPSSPPPCASNP